MNLKAAIVKSKDLFGGFGVLLILMVLLFSYPRTRAVQIQESHLQKESLTQINSFLFSTNFVHGTEFQDSATNLFSCDLLETLVDAEEIEDDVNSNFWLKTTKKFQALIDEQSLLFLLKPFSSIGLHISSVPFFILYQSWKCFPNSTY
jgi:hypothetical protein